MKFYNQKGGNVSEYSQDLNAVPNTESCVGGHCTINVEPNANSYMQNLKSANPPPGAIDQVPGYSRAGNNTQILPNRGSIPNTDISCIQSGGYRNSYNRIVNPKTNRSVSLNGTTGQKIFKSYVKRFSQIVQAGGASTCRTDLPSQLQSVHCDLTNTMNQMKADAAYDQLATTSE